MILLLLSLTGNDILAKVDSIMNAPRDRESVGIMVLVDRNGKKKERKIRMWQRGEKKLIRFLAPDEVKGVGFLSLSDERMYLFMPAFKKVRRIASHAKKESFMNSDFSYEDIGSSDYKKKWDGKIISETDSTWVLELTPKPGADVSYSKLIMEVKKSNYLVKRVEFYGKKGDKEKEMTMKKEKKVGNYWTFEELVMENLKTGHKTIMKLEDVKFDQGLSDNIFTERNLKRYR